MTMISRVLGVVSLALPALALWGAPNAASACGGTFCDSGPQAMPVDQTGENILFVMDGGYTEAHIQIQYDPETEAESFAWLIPVTVIPEFEVGSDQLFQNVLAATVPTYGFQTVFDDCADPMPDTSAGGEGGDGGDAPKFDAGAGTGGPEMVFEATVGAFDVVVIQGGTSDEVMQWLGDNGYQQDPAAEPIIEDYLQEGLMFAAFKLTNGAETSEIHPVVLRFPDSDEACIPIRLTRIAAQDDMEVRSFFLSNERIVPRNYRHVVINGLKLDWPNLASNYKEVISLAVDAVTADGKAFVTEYAGESSTVNRANLWSPSWDASPFVTIDPLLVIEELEAQGLVYCDGGFCEFDHALIQGLLAQYVPVPDGVEMDDFYSCLTCYEALMDPMAWDGDAFANDLQQRIFDPGQHATDILGQWPYLTRMYTTISPGEMTEDPFFHENPNLQTVTATQTATQRILCNGDAVWTLPDGREVYLPQGQPWPSFDDEMPWAEDIEEVPAAGAPMTLVDNTEQIDELLARYNAERGWPPSGAGEDTGGTSGSGSGSGGLDDRPAAGCSCRSGAGTPATLVLLGGLALLGLRRRTR